MQAREEPYFRGPKESFGSYEGTVSGGDPSEEFLSRRLILEHLFFQKFFRAYGISIENKNIKEMTSYVRTYFRSSTRRPLPANIPRAFENWNCKASSAISGKCRRGPKVNPFDSAISPLNGVEWVCCSISTSLLFG